MDVDQRLHQHNLQWQGKTLFLQQDPTLRRMRQNPLVHEPELRAALPLRTPGIYTLVGGRQVGKSTLLKQVMRRLLETEGVAGQRIAYVTCEPFVDAEELRSVLTGLLTATGQAGGMTWLLLDEVTYVRDWDRVVKFLADAGSLEHCFLLLTGSDHLVIQDSLKRLPGRRGRAEQVDFHLRPLSFLQFCQLRGNLPAKLLAAEAGTELEAPPTLDERHQEGLERELRDYHLSGGFLPAINDLAREGVVGTATLRTYADWIRGDVLRLDRNERYLREVLAAIDKRYGSQLTWNALAKDLSIDHPKTISDYVGILERMDAALVVPALAEHTHGPAPKKGRKVFFADPFIHRAVLHWLGEAAADAALASDLRLQRDLEGVFSCHVARFGECYYIKGMGEIDVAFPQGRRLQLIEVKWATQLRPEELKEIRRRGRGIIAARVTAVGEIEGVTVLPAAVVLLRLAGKSQVS